MDRLGWLIALQAAGLGQPRTDQSPRETGEGGPGPKVVHKRFFQGGKPDMPIKIFVAPGDHRDDFGHVESQANEWLAQTNAKIIGTSIAVNELPGKRDNAGFMLSLVIHYEQPGS
jgi:hypothetical protein